MKFITATVLTLTGLFAGSLANPVPVPAESVSLVPRSADVDSVFAVVGAHVDAAVQICLDADIDIDADISLRKAVAAKLKADLDIAIDLLVKLEAEIKAKAKVDILADNKGCDSKCFEKKLVDHSSKVCKGVEKITKKLGEDCVKDYVKPVVLCITRITVLLDKLFVGVALAVGSAIQVVLGLDVCLALGLDLDLLLNLGGLLGGIIGIGIGH